MANITTILILVILFSLSAAGARTKQSINGHDGMFVSPLVANDGICKSMVETQGYVCEEHTVTTQDGYILSLQRIPVGRSGKKPDKPPVLLQHGLIVDAVTWLINSPEESLAFILADSGFDVWLANTRGTNYSRGHTSLSPNDPAYWDWSWDELVSYDLPASFQYVHNQTGQKLHYVGHSLGTLIAFAAFSQAKLLNILRSAALLSPIAYLGQIPSPLARSVAETYIAEDLYWLGLNEFDPRGEVVVKLLEVICSEPGNNCADLLTAVTGQNCCLNSSKADVFLNHEPQSTATKNIIHLTQNGVRTKQYSINGHDGMFVASLVASDGICKSMVETQGYVCEEHTVTTQDGYILSVQRIPVGRSGKKPDKPPVLLQHGLMVDANTWLMNSPEGSLAFILADSGFDVWLSNTRGTNYSRGHTSLSANDPAYWEWSWDELVNYDLPASFQYVYSQTGQKLHYVGHSLGTLIALAAFSQEKLLNMLRSAALLSPIAYMGQMPALLARYSAQTFSAETLYRIGVRELSPTGGGGAQLLGAICNGPGINCADLMTATTGANCCLDPSAVASFLDHEPQSTATKNIIHLAQMIRGGTIAMYDYGNVVENSMHYRQPIPPVYDMSRIPKDLPLFLSYGGRDILSDVNDVQTLLRSLANHDADKLVAQYIEDYAHVDFILGANAKQVVYDPLMAFFNLH